MRMENASGQRAGQGIRLAKPVVVLCICLLLADPCHSAGPGDWIRGLFTPTADKFLDEMEDLRKTAEAANGAWQVKADRIQQDFARTSDELVKQGLAGLQSIEHEAIADGGAEARCTVDMVRVIASRKLDNLLHSLRHDGPPKPIPPLICDITPKPLDLEQPHSTLLISGSWLNVNAKPSVTIESMQGARTTVEGDYVSKATNYSETVRLDLLEARGVLGQNTRRLTVVFPGQIGTGEIEIIPVGTCHDNVRNGKETDVDCGGSICGKCGANKICKQDSDCSAAACLAGVCGKHSVSASPVAEVLFGGGPNGRPQTGLNCQQGAVATGFYGRIGNWFNYLGLYCSPVAEDASVSAGTLVGRTGGSSDGNTDRDAPCLPGRVLVGFRGKYGGFVDSMTGICADPHQVALVGNKRASELGADFTIDIKPSAGGADSEQRCPQGAAVSGFRVNAGFWIDKVYFSCRSISQIEAR